MFGLYAAHSNTWLNLLLCLWNLTYRREEGIEIKLLFIIAALLYHFANLLDSWCFLLYEDIENTETGTLELDRKQHVVCPKKVLCSTPSVPNCTYGSVCARSISPVWNSCNMYRENCTVVVLYLSSCKKIFFFFNFPLCTGLMWAISERYQKAGSNDIRFSWFSPP